MKIKSPAFENNQLIPSIYTCDGDNVNPVLRVSEVPEGTQSLALVVYDPDAPGKTFTHWLIWNINPDIKEIGESDWPQGSEQGMNDRGELGYTGPCPPSGTHHYHFKLYALNNKLNVSSNIKREELEREIQENQIADCELIGIYGKES